MNTGSPSPQDVYATNLQIKYGYPLRIPEPSKKLGEPYATEGFQIGDVGYVDDYGEFNLLFNIGSPLPNELCSRGSPPHIPINLDRPSITRHAISSGRIFSAGIKQQLDDSRGTYSFTATSNAGAILILPSSATLCELRDPEAFETLLEVSEKYAALWCEFSRCESLYVITGTYKTRSWILGAFEKGRSGGKIAVERQDDGTYEWRSTFEVDIRPSPRNNHYKNQTVIIKGFKIKRPHALLPSIFSVSPTWLSRVEHDPRLSQPCHPSDFINRYLLEKNPGAQVAVTHDDKSIDMLENESLTQSDLMPGGPLQDADNPRGTTTMEGPNHDTVKRFPNDLTNQVIRDGHDPVASGGFADIYRGTFQENGESTKVAIKAIKTYSGEDGDFSKKQKRLRREIKVWLNLRHANVLPLLGTTVGFGRFPAMVCPWVENGPLTSYLEGCYNSLPVVDILGLLDNVACGLQYLHSRSVVHGDLSGSNVLIHEDGRAYIADFGLSMLLTELGGSTFATSFHARGTLRWTAPELLDLEVPENGMEEESPRTTPTTQCDVYSFGRVMLQILSGKVPFHYYAREAQVMHAISRGMTPMRPSSALLTERRWMFIQQCWSTVDVTRSRPSSGEIVKFTKEELAGSDAS